MAMNPFPELAHRVADQLGAIPGVAAVVLGGSWARGTADTNSDIDLGIYYEPDQPPALDDLRELAARLDDGRSGEVVTDFGAWGPWINGGGWLTIEGQRVDWLYRDLGQVRQAIDQCRAGQPAIYYQAGHPHGFHTPIYMGEVHLCQPLFDPRGVVADLKALTTPYPHALKKALIDRFLWEAGFAVETSYKPASRGEAFYVSGALFRCAACLVQVLYALNERYWINEKGSVKAAGSFPLTPPDFEASITHVLGALGTNAEAITARLHEMERVVEAVRGLVEQATSG